MHTDVPREKNVLVHERVKKKSCLCHSTHNPRQKSSGRSNPKKFKTIIFANHLTQVQMLNKPTYSRAGVPFDFMKI